MANAPFDPGFIGMPEQATNGGFEDYAWNYPTIPLGGLSFETESSWEDLMTPQSESAQPMSPQSESAQPMDYGLGDSGGIELETGTEGSQYASDMGRNAPPSLNLSGDPMMHAVNVAPLHMLGAYSYDSLPAEVSGSPLTADRQYLAATPMTPLEEQGVPSPDLSYQPPSVAASVASEVSNGVEDTIVEYEVPNAMSFGKAVRLTVALSSQEEGSNLVHGRINQMKSLPEAKVAKPQVQCDTTNGERVVVQFKLPSYCQTMEEYIKKNSLEEDGGYFCMESVMRVVRTLERLHSKLQSGHGAFSDLSSIRMRVSPRTRHLVTFLIPELNKLAKAMELTEVVSDEELASGGMLSDIWALGDLLNKMLPYLREKQIHVSEKLLSSLEYACRMCQTATSRGDMAKIAQALNFKKCLCTLHVKFPPECLQRGLCTLDIVCYEGENIYEVIRRSWLNGRTLESYGRKLYYEDSHWPVGKDNEVFYPVCKTYLTTPSVQGSY